MVSAAMITQEQHLGSGSGGPMPSLHETVSSEADKGLALSKQQLKPVDEVLPKVRKPYTITKQRERWTDEEHKKFLEALKLYGRAWRKIEEHVVTKTAVQIRSHAQKFFSKVTRDSNGGEGINLKPIEIPPPRPKRKPMHPYPRKEVATLVKPRISIPEKQTSSASLSTDLSGSEQDKQSSSPTSVLSAVNGSSSPVSSNLVLKVGGSFGSEAPNTSSDDNHSVLARDAFSLDESASGQCLKLFGKTLVFADNQGSLYRNECNKDLSPKRVVPVKCIMNGDNMDSAADACSPFHLTWLTLCSGLSLSTTTEILSPTPIKACFKCDDGSKESSSVQSDSDDRSSEERSRVVDSCSPLNLEFKGQVKILGNRISADSLKGFVPYKRCVMDRDSAVSSADNPDEREKRRIRLCT